MEVLEMIIMYEDYREGEVVLCQVIEVYLGMVMVLCQALGLFRGVGEGLERGWRWVREGLEVFFIEVIHNL